MASNERMRTSLQALVDVGSGKLAHAYNGMCPDEIEGYDVRDDECPACRALVAAQDLLDGK